MSATVLISGKLFREPERKTSRDGKVYASATVRDGHGDDAQWWKLSTFSETAAEELLSLHDGDGIAASGSFKAEIYDRGGGARIALTIFADRVISAKRQKRERAQDRKAEPRPISEAEASRPFDDASFGERE
jgi:single-stranded DNA-binding protein